jgi:FdrA protein
MIDQRSRLERIGAEAADPGTAVLLLDVVLGHGAHPDPASELAPALADAVRTAAADGRSLALVVSLCGTEGDPQGLARQGDALAAAGALVHRSNADAARAAAALTQEAG